MYTLKLLAPFVASLCMGNFVEKQGELCNVRQEPPSVLQYYEPGKSCYVNGTFYKKCEDRLNGTI